MPKVIHNRRTRRSGFTLLEILIVVGIIALLAAFVVPNLIGASNKAKIQLAESTINNSNGSFATAIKTFQVQMGRYPKELKELTERPDGEEAKKWAGPYFEDAAKLKDPWSNDYEYAYPSKIKGDGYYDIWSKGPDGQDGTDDDISNWPKQ